jgi:hypothetical protein
LNDKYCLTGKTFEDFCTAGAGVELYADPPTDQLLINYDHRRAKRKREKGDIPVKGSEPP